jgi:hypothetical protein
MAQEDVMEESCQGYRSIKFVFGYQEKFYDTIRAIINNG